MAFVDNLQKVGLGLSNRHVGSSLNLGPFFFGAGGGGARVPVSKGTVDYGGTPTKEILKLENQTHSPKA